LSHNLWEARVTALACEIADSLKLIAPPVEGANIKARIAAAAKATGLSYWRAWDLWYGKARRIDAHEADAIRTARARRAERASHDLQALAVEMETLAERLAALAALGSRQEVDRAWAIADRVRRLAGGV
jgi:uncharacterized protein (DUF1684 family)